MLNIFIGAWLDEYFSTPGRAIEVQTEQSTLPFMIF